MKRGLALLRETVDELWALIVDDGFLALAALAAVAATFLLSRESVLGPVDAVGWILVFAIVVAMVLSVRRGIRSKRSG